MTSSPPFRDPARRCNHDTPSIVVLIGLPASGKTTFYKARFPNHVHVSKDLMRSARNKAHRQETLVRQALSSGHSVVIDNTNVTLKERCELISQAKQFGARIIGYYFAPALSENFARNRLRKGVDKVPDVAIFAAAKLLEKPGYEEGYDELYKVEIRKGHGFRVWPAEKTKNI
jgi:predicted kinase